MQTISKQQYDAQQNLGSYVANVLFATPDVNESLINHCADQCYDACERRMKQDNKAISTFYMFFIPDWDKVNAPGGAIVMHAS